MGGSSLAAMGDWGRFLNAPGTFSIEGSDAQVLTLTVPPGDHLICEPGSMMHSSANLQGTAECAPGCCQRCCCMNESCFQNKYTNPGQTPGYIGLTPSFMAKIIAIDMKNHPNGMIMEKTLAQGEKLRIDQNSIVGYDMGMNFDMEWAGCCGSCCGGECCFATIEGPGQVYMQSMSFEKYKAAVVPKPKQKGDKGGGQ